MTTALLDRPPAPTAPNDAVLFLLAEGDRADLWRAVDRVVGATFCSRLDPSVVTFTGSPSLSPRIGRICLTGGDQSLLSR